MPPVWMLLLFCCEWASSAPDVAQSVHLTVAYGDSVTLPCNGSAFVDEEDVEVVWEAMGSDVASIRGGVLNIEERYKDHVRFASEGQTAAGNWSIVMYGVVLSDSDMYECIYRGRRTLSTVWLTVEPPEVESVVEVYLDNDSAILPCVLDLPRNQSPDDLKVWWEKDGQVLLEKMGPLGMVIKGDFVYLPEDFNYDFPRNIDSFPLFVTTNVTEIFFGEFTCWYQTKDSDDPKPGIPGTVNLILKEEFYESENSTQTEGSTEGSGSAPFWFTPFWLEETTTEEMPVLLDPVTAPLEESTRAGPLSMEANEETATSFPDGDPEDPESMDWSDFPWVRTGLIAGVLLVTAVMLCILGALHKL